MAIAPGPIPFQTNPAVMPQYLVPGNFPITGIVSDSTGQQANVTVNNAVFGQITISPNFVIGQLVRFNIPRGWGMQQLNGQLAYVTAINGSVYTCNINLYRFDSFVTPATPPFSYQKPQISAVGDQNSGWAFNGTKFSFTQLSPPGAFQNISPFLGE